MFVLKGYCHYKENIFICAFYCFLYVLRINFNDFCACEYTMCILRININVLYAYEYTMCILKININVLYACEYTTYVMNWGWRLPIEAKKVCWIPETGVTSGHEPLKVGSGKQT